MQRVAELRANRLTHWAAAAWKPEGTVVFQQISARLVLSAALLRTATIHLIYTQIRLVRMVPFKPDTL